MDIKIEKPTCKICGNSYRVVDKGKISVCSCVNYRRNLHYLRAFLPTPPPEGELEKYIDSARKKLKCPKSKKWILPRFQSLQTFNTFWVSILLSSGLARDYQLITLTELIDIYLGNVEDRSMYDFNKKLIIVNKKKGSMPNSRSSVIISQLANYHPDKTVIFYQEEADKSLEESLISYDFKKL